MTDYLVFFVRDPVDDELADADVDRLRGLAGAGWFDDPGAATAAERTTGGYVRCAEPSGAAAAALLDVARAVSADHGVAVEVQWREEPVGRLERGRWLSGPP
jgi:hypothetical protein